MDVACQRGVECRSARGAGAVVDGVYEAIDEDDFYDSLAEQGFGYSGPFRSLRGIGADCDRPDVVYAEVELPADTDISGYGIHPALLDAALHALAAFDQHRSDPAGGAQLGCPLRLPGSPCTPRRPPGCMSS